MFRLAPFCNVRRDGEVILLETPDRQLNLRSEAGELLERLAIGVSELTPDVSALLSRGVVVKDSKESELLRKLEVYFKAQNLPAQLIRRGSTVPEAALPRPGYVFKTSPNVVGVGQADEAPLAMLKAVVEGYERISCDVGVNPEILVPRRSGIAPLDPGLFVKYSRWQYDSPNFPFIERSSDLWAAVREVLTGDLYRIPLELVCTPDGITGQRATRATSNGVASHTSYDAAVMGSVFELIERDALLLHWFWDVSRERIVPPPELKPRVEKLAVLGFECTFLNFTLEVAPVVLAIVWREPTRV